MATDQPPQPQVLTGAPVGVAPQLPKPEPVPVPVSVPVQPPPQPQPQLERTQQWYEQYAIQAQQAATRGEPQPPPNADPVLAAIDNTIYGTEAAVMARAKLAMTQTTPGSLNAAMAAAAQGSAAMMGQMGVPGGMPGKGPKGRKKRHSSNDPDEEDDDYDPDDEDDEGNYDDDDDYAPSKNKKQRKGSMRPEKKFPCDHCDKKYASKAGVRAHFRKVHEGQEAKKHYQPDPVLEQQQSAARRIEWTTLTPEQQFQKYDQVATELLRARAYENLLKR